MTTPSTEFPCCKPNVYQDGELTTWACMNVEAPFGVVPGKALLWYGRADWDYTGPITLNAQSGTGVESLYGSRIIVVDEADSAFNIYHLGQYLQRQDQGESNSLLFTSVDDRHWLARIPIRGALVYDTSTTPIKFIRRAECHMNPLGEWNMTFVPWAGDSSGYMPVFAPKAQIGYTYQSGSEYYAPVYGSVTSSNIGKIYPWTPRWALYYFWFLTQLDATSSIPGICADYPTGPDFWRSLTNCTRLKWDNGYMTPSNMIGYDPAVSGSDPLDRNLPDTKFTGLKILGAIDKILEISGTHQLNLAYVGSTVDDCYSSVRFYPIFFSSAIATQPQYTVLSIPLVRGGQLGTSYSAHDFQLDEDATNTCELALVDGAVVHQESNIGFLVQNSSSEIQQGWTSAWMGLGEGVLDEETAFKMVITGQPSATAATAGQPSDGFCRYPNISQQANNGVIPPFSSWLTADGKDGRAYCPVSTALKAVEFAWSFFPRVYRAFYISSQSLDSLSKLDGWDHRYSDETKYPALWSNRQILLHQLWFFMNNVTTSSSNLAAWTKNKLPIRMSIQAYTYGNTSGGSPIDDKFYEFPQPLQIAMDSDGLIWIDGLQTEQEASNNYRIYSGSLLQYQSVWGCSVKQFNMNVAYPLDLRVIGTAALPAGQNSSFTDDYNAQLNGPPFEYSLEPGSYHQDHQYLSRPSASDDLAANGPISQILPPGDEGPFAVQAAQRLLYGAKQPERKGIFRVIGIRPEIQPGLWVDKVQIINSDNIYDTDYDMNTPIWSVLYDFMAQETVIGGLRNMASRYTTRSYAIMPAGSQNLTYKSFRTDTHFTRSPSMAAPVTPPRPPGGA